MINGLLLALLVECVVQVCRGELPWISFESQLDVDNNFGGTEPELKAKNRKGGTKLAVFKVMVILAQV